MLHGHDVNTGLKRNLTCLLITGIAMNTIFVEISQEKHHNLLFKDLENRSVMFKL